MRWKNKKEKETNEVVIENLIKKFNEYVKIWNDWEQSEHEKWLRREPSSLDFNTYQGNLKLVHCWRKRSLGMYEGDKPEYFCEVVTTAGYKEFVDGGKGVSTFCKNLLSREQVQTVWKHKTEYHPDVIDKIKKRTERLFGKANKAKTASKQLTITEKQLKCLCPNPFDWGGHVTDEYINLVQLTSKEASELIKQRMSDKRRVK